MNEWWMSECSPEFVLRSKHTRFWVRWGRFQTDTMLRLKVRPDTWENVAGKALNSSSASFPFFCFVLFFFLGRLMLKVWRCSQKKTKKKKESGTEWIGSTAGGKTIRHRCTTLVWGNVTIQRVVLWQARLPCWKAEGQRQHTLARTHLRSSFVNGGN